MHFVNSPELGGTRSVHREVKWTPGVRWVSLEFFLSRCAFWYMCYQWHTQSHTLAVKFHEVHFEDQIPTPVFSYKHRPFVLHF